MSRSAWLGVTLAAFVALHAAASLAQSGVEASGGVAGRHDFALVASIEAAHAQADADAALLTSRRLIVPIAAIPRSALRDTFNERRGGSWHEAIDIAAPRGTPVLAVGDGRVIKMFYSVRGGYTVYQFDPDDRFAYYYAHLDSYAVGIKEGMAVRRGDLLGYVGSTGNAPADAPHLHFAIFRLGPDKRWWQGTAVNPYPFLHDPER